MKKVSFAGLRTVLQSRGSASGHSHKNTTQGDQIEPLNRAVLPTVVQATPATCRSKLRKFKMSRTIPLPPS